MAKSSIVDFVTRVIPPVELGPDRTPPISVRNELVVELAENRTLKVAATHQAIIAFAYALEFSRRTQSPLKLTYDEVGGFIDQIDVAVVSSVLDIVQDRHSERLKVRLKQNQTVYFLDKNAEQFESMMSVLRTSANNGSEVLLVGQEGSSQIENVVDLSRESKRHEEDESDFDLASEITAVSDQEAEELMCQLIAMSCDPKMPSGGCIPFLFPDHGCEVRAHAAVRRLVDGQIIPGKLWAFGFLEATTDNYPSQCETPPCRCFVGWGYHVAPYVYSKERPGEKVVLDPSLFQNAVSEAEWLQRLDPENLTLKETSYTVYLLDEATEKPEYDPCFTRTEEQLFELRVKLCLRAWQVGPPPYDFCMTPNTNS